VTSRHKGIGRHMRLLRVADAAALGCARAAGSRCARET
jgi:hypothetical protein